MCSYNKVNNCSTNLHLTKVFNIGDALFYSTIAMMQILKSTHNIRIIPNPYEPKQGKPGYEG